MPKSLGQIHTLNYNLETFSSAVAPGVIGNNGGMLLDCSQALSSQLQRNIHQAAYFKCVGIDLTLDSPESLALMGGTKGSVKGRLRYFAPTQGRCEAYRTAFTQMMAQMKERGIDHRHNKMYDFRVTLRDPAFYPLNPVFSPLFNLATLDGLNILSLTDGVIPGSEIFDTHNLSVVPAETAVPVFSEGLTTQIGTVVPPTDFVKQEGLIYSGTANTAMTGLEEIPFVLAWDQDNEQAVSLQWRPDPVLYIPLMLGQIEIVFDEIVADGAVAPDQDGVEVNIAVHIAGWKSILGSGRPRRSSRKSSSKSRKSRSKSKAKK